MQDVFGGGKFSACNTQMCCMHFVLEQPYCRAVLSTRSIFILCQMDISVYICVILTFATWWSNIV